MENEKLEYLLECIRRLLARKIIGDEGTLCCVSLLEKALRDMETTC